MLNNDELYHEMAIKIINEDFREIIYLFSCFRKKPIPMLSMLPYAALFCTEVDSVVKSENVITNDKEDIKKIRLNLKLFCDKYGKSITKITCADLEDDDHFKNQLRFKWMQKLNWHYNLGVYYCFDKYIIANTQSLNFIKKGNKSLNKLNKHDIFELGYNIGSALSSIASILNQNTSLEQNITINSELIKYKDYNTSKIGFSNICNKEISLLLIHIISNINFILYYLSPLLKRNSKYLFRIAYICYYYSVQSLDRLKNHINQNEYSQETKKLCNHLKYDSSLLNSSFRSCMMHYSFKNQNHYLIDENVLDLTKPFYGLIQTHFDGYTFENLLEKMFIELVNISEQIDNSINLSKSNLKT